MNADATFLQRFEHRGQGVRVALKDLIDVTGTITTAGSPAVASTAQPAIADAECIRHIRTAEALGEVSIVGKVNLHELAYGGDGINPHYGTPVNPCDPLRVPGGSSSGSAVAVATDQADVALGSDTGGSVRIPAACCGVVGLKTTWGRIPLGGVWPLAPTLDTIGPLGRTCAAVVTGMNLLEPGFRSRTTATSPATVIGRVRSPGGWVADAGLEEAVDAALAAAGIRLVELEARWWEPAVAHGLTALLGEANRTIGFLLDGREHLIEPRIAARIRLGGDISNADLARALAFRPSLQRSMADEMRRSGAQLIATPTLPVFAPFLDAQAVNAPYTMYTRPANLAGTPALAMPVPVPYGLAPVDHRHLPASLQLMGPIGSEELIMATALRIEAALAT